MISRRLGVEVELLAPPGLTRRDLADSIAAEFGGSVKPIFYAQSEPSKVPGQLYFENLTLGFQVFDDQGAWVASCVDDLTLQKDLEKQTRPRPGWYRVLSDDSRLLHLIAKHARPSDPLESILQPVAELWGSAVEPGPNGMFRVSDPDGKAIAIAAPLPGERERPCELVTAPIQSDHREHLACLLELVRDLGFTAPSEGATHLHFDGADLQNAATFSNLVRLFHHYGSSLKAHFEMNPNCRRLGAWPSELLQAVEEADFQKRSWDQLLERLRTVKLTKYCDFNLTNLLLGRQHKLTFEVRVLPVRMEVEPIIQAAELIESMLDLAGRGQSVTLPAEDDMGSLRELLKSI